MIKNRLKVFKVSPAEELVIEQAGVNISKISREAVLNEAMKKLKSAKKKTTKELKH